MKILFISEHQTQASNGWGRYTIDLRQALVKAGHDVATLDDVIKKPFLGKFISRPTSYLCPPVSFFMPIRFLADIFIVRAAVRLYTPDVIHVTMEPYALLLPFLGVSHIPVVVTIHGTYSYIPNVVFPILRPLYRYFFLKALSVAHGIVSVSHYTKAYLLKNITTDSSKEVSRKIFVIHNGVDLSQTSFVEYSASKGEKKIILTVGAVKRRKGLRESLHAVACYKEKYGVLFVYRIAGSYNPESAYFKQLSSDIEKFNIKDDVVFLGKVSDKELKQQYMEADLFLMLPVDDLNRFEGFGLVYLEANAYGVPSIGSRNAGSAEAIQDGVSGYLVDPTNTSEVADRIHSVLSQDMINRHECRIWAENHAIEKMAKEYALLYSKVVELNNKKHKH